MPVAAIDQETIAWVNQEAANLAHQGLVPGSPREKEILKSWQLNRPRMLHQLRAQGIAEKMAFVLDQKQNQARKQYLQAGMPPTDAEEQATKDWLMLGPETEPEP